MPRRPASPTTDFREPLLAALLPRLAAATEARPMVRCWSESGLRAELVAIGKELKERGVTVPAAPQLIAWLSQIKLAHPVAVEAAAEGWRTRFFTLSLEQADGGADVHPIELLQAYAPRGVICYFTALSIHALTTQPPSHHTIAELVTMPARAEAASAARVARTAPGAGPEDGSTSGLDGGRRPPSPPRRTFNPLGSRLFDYQGVPYYESKRDSRRMPGVQRRYLDARAMYRITTREQTLLDTLHRPASCGGPEVIFEAWRTAVEDLDEKQLGDALVAIDDPDLFRRTAAMLALVEHDVGAALQTLLRRHEDPNAARIPLLPGLDYGRLNDRWKVLVP